MLLAAAFTLNSVQLTGLSTSWCCFKEFVAIFFCTFLYQTRLCSVIMRHNLADSQDFTFTSLAAAAAHAQRDPGATQDLICLWKRGILYFPLFGQPKKISKLDLSWELLKPTIRFYSFYVSFSVGWSSVLKVVVCASVPCWFKLGLGYKSKVLRQVRNTD